MLHLHLTSTAETNEENEILELANNDARGYMSCCGRNAYRITAHKCRSLNANVKCELAIK